MNHISAGFSPNDHDLVDAWTDLRPFGLAARVIVDHSADVRFTIEVFRPRSDQPLWIITVQPDATVTLLRDTDGALPMTLWTIDAALSQIVHEEAVRQP